MSISRGSRRHAPQRPYRDTLRDAFLLGGLWPPIETDGRSRMSQFDDRGEDGLQARRAVPGPYALPEHWRTTPDVADLELARRAPAMGLRRVRRLDVDVRDRLLDELRLDELRRRDRDEQAELSEAQHDRIQRHVLRIDTDTDDA